ncbi:glycosyltransferase family 4 protein [Yersinia intermedia]|uniref:Putative glycosyl transferase n=1 Tax=Yersinia intermedia TaxID=631 RepID=A0A0T9M5V5_YERIN|nr:glycosyltransferase family 4 protein [Yersinia intermedia]MCB5297633.1 glycosyltransferase family 4 protein [Yersinia intermedia]CNF65034.1 putative glycosyl transferase [Yersinia intermedia]CNJ77462.1 putative glycosyl transferase [Yersinia intermedia]
MKVLYIITRASEIGGAQVHVKDLCVKLLTDGHNPEVIVGESGPLVDMLENKGVKVHILPSLVRDISPMKDLLCVFQLRQLVKKIKPDLVTLHSSKAGIIGRLSLVASNIPVVFTVHGWSFADGVSEKKKKLYIWIERVVSIFTDKIITVSEQDKKLALKYRVTSNSKQVVIHNGIPDKTVEISSVKFDECVRLISVARFCEQKDHETLLYALHPLRNEQWHLSLVGKGPNLSRIKDLAVKLELDMKVDFLGERSDVESLIASSDILLLISNWEGFPMSILEGMRASLPVIASDVGGVNEAVKDGVTGYLVKKADVLCLTECIKKLLDNKTLRLNMGKNGGYLFDNEFTFDSMYKKTFAVYNSVSFENKKNIS